MSIYYKEPILIDWFRDENGVKISLPRTNEEKVVIENIIVLDYLPDVNEGISFNGGGAPTTEINIKDEITSMNQYKVDYSIGYIYVHPDRDAELLSMDYFKRGVVYYPASRMYMETSGGNITKTVKQVLEDTQEILNNAQEGIEVLEDINNFEHLDTYSPSVDYKKYNIVRYEGVAYICTNNTTAGTLPTNANFWKVIAFDGEAQGIPVGGDEGQILKKSSSTDYDAEWVDFVIDGGGA